MTQRILHR